MTQPTKKWRFRHCFWIEKEPPTLADFEPLRRPYEYKGTRGGPPGNGSLTDVDVQRAVDAADEPGQSSWCVTGVIETLGTLSEREVDEFSWEVVSEHAYQVIKEIIWGNEWYEGGVEPLNAPSSPSSASATVPQADLDVINRYRRGMGRGPIDPGAGWTPAELREMAHSIRTTGRESNPRTRKLKRRLMR